MERDKNIIQFYKNLNPAQYLKPEDSQASFYVPLYEEEIEEIRLELLYGQSSETIYVSGQTGSGKTTALNFLPDDRIRAQFIIEDFYANEMLQLDNVDIVDILMMLAFRLVRDYDDLKLLLGQRIIEIGEQLRGNLEKTEETTKDESLKLNVGLFAKFAALVGQSNFGADYGFNQEKRKITRQVLKPQLEELISAVNDIIGRYMDEKVPKNDKKLLLFLHDLNHMIGAQHIKDLFINNRHYLEQISAVKIVTIPVGLRALPLFQPDIVFLGLKVKSNPNNIQATDEQKISNNKQSLKNIIKKRIPNEADIIDEETLDEAVNQSGGIVRQLVDILQRTSLKCMVDKESRIYGNHLREGMGDVRRKLSRSIITKSHIQTLSLIQQESIDYIDDDKLDLFIESAAVNQIIAYKNDDIWYDINPLIENTVKTYAANLAKNGE